MSDDVNEVVQELSRIVCRDQEVGGRNGGKEGFDEPLLPFCGFVLVV